MSKPILSISESPSSESSTANLLPCRIQHDGPVAAPRSLWNPVQQDNGSSISYFRGRKLTAKPTQLPTTHRGVLVERQEKQQASGGDTRREEDHTESDNVDQDTDNRPEEAQMKVLSEFKEIMVWGHEDMATAEGDVYLRGVQEWIGLADQIHSFEESKGGSEA